MRRLEVACFVGISVLAGCLAGFGEGVARAQACDTHNLLLGKKPWQWQDVKGNSALITDGAIGPEGTQWDAPVGVVLDTGAGSVTYDLGEPTPISAVYIQADANDTYKIMGSLDGAPTSFKMLVEIDNVADRGHEIGRASCRERV